MCTLTRVQEIVMKVKSRTALCRLRLALRLLLIVASQGTDGVLDGADYAVLYALCRKALKDEPIINHDH